MPKTNDNTGATYAGYDGIVEHGAPLNDGRVLSELDPEKNLDGTWIDGEHSDREDDEEERDVSLLRADPSSVSPVGEPAPGQAEPENEDAPADREEEPSPGNSSKASTAKTASTPGKNASRR